MAHSQAQDVLWLDDAEKAISATMFRAYFVERGPGNKSQFYAVVPLTPHFKTQHAQAWSRFTKNGDTFRLSLHHGSNDEDPAGSWQARLMGDPDRILALKEHPLGEHDLVVLVRRPLPADAKHGPDFEVVTFDTRKAADAALESDL